jgi:hypothetical protein
VYRLAFFKAGITQTSGLHPFSYNAESFFNPPKTDPEGLDKKRNCKEWQQKVGTKVSTEDIYEILYETKFEPLGLAHIEGDWQLNFAENSFMQALILPKNKELLTYLLFAKRLEYDFVREQVRGRNSVGWESWDALAKDEFISPEIGIKIDSLICEVPTMKDNFLKMRYAFLLMREHCSDNKGDFQLLHDAIFKNELKNSLIQDWAIGFGENPKNAFSNEANRNYVYSLSFDRCEEKKFWAVQAFDNKPKFVTEALQLAQNQHERGVIKVMSIIQKNSPQLPKIIEIADLLPNSHYLAFLISKEINKLEDWIFTPKFTTYCPSIIFSAREGQDWFGGREKTLRKNLQTDIAYLRKLKAFLKKIYPKSTGEMHDFLAVSIAHLCFLDDELAEGNQYLAQISANANPSILMQKNIDLTLNYLKGEDISTVKTQEKIALLLNQLDKKCLGNFEMYKNLYTLLRAVSNEYEQKQDFATAGLLFMKSEYYKRRYEMRWYDYEAENLENYTMANEKPDAYMRIGYFDRFATTQDMDKVINMLQKTQKTHFEQYLCKQPLAYIDFYKDIKGTIAFRNDDLELAYQTFKQIPDSFWRKKYEYRNYLNENPFVPKSWRYVQKPHFDYAFNKADFLAEMIRLKKELEQNPAKKAENYLKLAHAYYNCSYWGNAWMMCAYERSSWNIFTEGYLGEIFGKISEKREKIQKGNYLKCSLSKEYYQKALQFAENDEQRAMASLMIHQCEYNAFLIGLDKSSTLNRSENGKDYKGKKSLKDFYHKYSHTAFYQQFECPLLEEYL